MVHVLKNVKKRSWAKNYCSVSLLSVVSKVFEKFVNKRLVDTPKKYGLFSDFQYDFRSSWSIANLRIAASDRIVRTFNRSGATWAVALDISKAFGRVWHFGLVHKFKSYGIHVRYFTLYPLFSVRNGFGWFRMGSLHENIQLILEFLKTPFLVLHFSH